MGWDGWKKVFYWGCAIWLSGTIAMQIARTNSPSYSTRLFIDNVGTIYALIGIATFVLGIVLLCRWAWPKFQGDRNSRGAFPQTPSPGSERVSNPSSNSNTKWEALVKYDDEIRAAAEKLLPFGAEWVNRLGDAFFALNEDRSYLANIVERLRSEATHEAERRWKRQFSRTAEGEYFTQESLAVLLELRERGYVVDVQNNGAIKATNTKGSSSFLYSNADIQRFGEILSRRAV